MSRGKVSDGAFLAVMLAAPMILTLLEYVGQPWHFQRVLTFFPGFRPSYALFSLLSYLYWIACCFVGFLVLPTLLVKLVLKDNVSSFGLARPDIGKTLRIYVILFLMVLPFIAGASFMPSFRMTYPFFQAWRDNVTYLLIFELFYGFQFFCVEYFFRGFMLFTLTRKLGFYGIVGMIIPYCMIHYHKPLPEALAAIGAGLILGGVAYHTRSIWSGVLIHVSVAWTMDFLSIAHNLRIHHMIR
jgi:membrane protease YdiL (CAAX protease family)